MSASFWCVSRPASLDFVSELFGSVLAELYEVRPLERARRRWVEQVEDVLLRYEHQGDQLPGIDALLFESGELVDYVRACLLQKDVRLVEHYDQMDLAFLEVLPEDPEHLCNGEAPVGEVGLEVVHDARVGARLAVPLPAVHEHPVHGL